MRYAYAPDRAAARALEELMIYFELVRAKLTPLSS